MSQPIRMYDLAGADDRVRFSPYCWRIKLALAHKGLAVETIPWRFTDKEVIAFSGQSRVPVILDGERVVFESWTIAEYLQANYPRRAPLFAGEAGRALARFHNQWATESVQPAMARLLVPDIATLIHDKDVGYFVTSRQQMFGATLDELIRARSANLEKLQLVLKPLNSTLVGQPFLAGEQPSYADFAVFGAFQWARVVSPMVLFADDDPVAAWRERMLDAYGGLARAMPARAAQ